MQVSKWIYLSFAAAIAVGSSHRGQCPTELAKLINPVDGFPNEGWATSVATQGDWAVVGSRASPSLTTQSGAAYVFKRNPTTGVWSFNSKLTASDADAGDHFGQSVSIAGDRLAIGASGDDEFAMGAGAVYVFRHSDLGWIQEAKVLPNDSTTLSLGTAVSLYDDTVATTEPDSSTGSVYFYRRDGSSWSLEQHSFFSSSQFLQHPEAVSPYQNTCFVGAKDALMGSLGTVYVFNRSGTSWTETQAISPPQPIDAHEEFGFSVAVEGTRAVIGATRHDHPFSDTGAAYTYKVLQNGQWDLDQKLSPADAAGGEFFGYSVALHNGKILVGALSGTASGVPTGAAYQFNRQGGAWIQVAKYNASDAEGGADYGEEVSLWTDAFVGASSDDNTIGANAGSAYVYGPCP